MSKFRSETRNISSSQQFPSLLSFNVLHFLTESYHIPRSLLVLKPNESQTINLTSQMNFNAQTFKSIDAVGHIFEYTNESKIQNRLEMMYLQFRK